MGQFGEIGKISEKKCSITKFCIGGEITYIKINFIDSRFNEFVTILISHNF